MNLKDALQLSLNHLAHKKVRTVLTILMVVIGVASIVALTSQTAGVSQNIQSSLASLGPTSITITASGSTVFTNADVANLETLSNISSVTPVVTGSATMVVNGNSSSVTVVGISTAGLQELLGNSINLYQGSLYQDSVAPLAVIGHSVAFSSSTDTSLQTVKTGETATIEVSSGTRGGSTSKVSVPIVGILQAYGSSIVPVDGSFIVSMPFAEVLLHKTTFNEILVKANNPKNVSSLVALITTIYGTKARVQDTQQLASTVSSITGETNLLFIVIAGISLIVAAIGIMNVMLMAVSERIHDIGIMKSVGFKGRDVLLIFLLQAVVIGLAGGVLGIAAGAGASYSLTSFISPTSSNSVSASHTVSTTGAAPATTPTGGFSRAGGSGFSGGTFTRGAGAGTASSSTSTLELSYHPVFTISVIAEALIIAITISVIAGIYPAWKASKMEPIDALREL